MIGAVLYRTNFNKAIMLNSHLAGADIQMSNFSGANLSGVALSTTTLAKNSFQSANLSGAALDDADLSGADLSSANLSQANLMRAKLDGATLNHAVFDGANLTSASLVAASGTQASFRAALLRQATLDTAALTNANFRSAQMNRASFKNGVFSNSDMRRAVLADAEFDGAGLTGVLINRATVLSISTDAAVSLGMVMDSVIRMYVVFGSNTGLDSVQSSLKTLGVEVTPAKDSLQNFKGDPDLDLYSAVLMYNALTDADMPKEGQVALTDFVKDGGVFIHTASTSYSAYNGCFFGQMLDLILFDYGTNDDCGDNGDGDYDNGDGDGDGGGNLVLNPAQKTPHPVLDGLTFPLTMNTTSIVGEVRKFGTNNVMPLLIDASSVSWVVTRDLGQGHIVGFSTCGLSVDEPGDTQCLSDSNFVKMVANAAAWVTPSSFVKSGK